MGPPFDAEPAWSVTMTAVKVTAVMVAFVLPVAVLAGEIWRHSRARTAEFPAVASRPGSDGASWYENDWRLLRMAASRLGFVLPAFLVSFSLAVAGLLVLLFRRSVPACCQSPVDWVALVVGVLGLSGAASFGGSAANRLGKRRAAARFRSLATTLPAAPPMWMALFTEVRAVRAAFPPAYLPRRCCGVRNRRGLRSFRRRVTCGTFRLCASSCTSTGTPGVASRCPDSGWSDRSPSRCSANPPQATG